MGKFARHQPRGNVAKDILATKKRIRHEGTARSLTSSTIGEGGILVKDGASVTVEGGGGVSVGDGGSIIARYPTGNAAAYFGRTSTDVHGLLIRADQESGTDATVLAAFTGLDGLTNVYQGWSSGPLNQAWTWANQIVLDAAAFGGSTYITHSTTSNPASCYIAANGAIQRFTSALKYKQDVESPDSDALADAALRLNPRTWRDKGDVERDSSTTQRYLGFIAEEVSEIGLDVLVTRNEETGEPEGLAYGQITAPLVALAQRQEREIRALRDRVDAQDSVIAALTARLDALEARDGG